MDIQFSIICVLNTDEITDTYHSFLVSAMTRTDTEVILYDILCTPNTKNLINSLKKEANNSLNANLTCKERENWTIWQCYNEAMSECRGKYVNFTKITAHFNTDELSRIKEAFAAYNTTAVTLIPYQTMGNKQTCPLYFRQRNGELDLTLKPFHTNMCLETYFIEKKAFQKYRFQENPLSETAEFTLVKFLDEIKRYALINITCEIEEYKATDAYNYSNAYCKDWYTKELSECYLPFVSENTSTLCQAWILQLIMFRLNANINDRNKAILTTVERDAFFDTVSEIFSHINDNVLTQYNWPHRRMMGRYTAMLFLQLKYRTSYLPVHIQYVDHDNPASRVAVYNNTIIESLKEAVLNIKTINWEQQHICFDGELANMYYADYDHLKLYVCMGNEKIPAVRTDIYSYTKFFGKPVRKGYMFHVEIPEKIFHNRDVEFYFEIEYLGELIRPIHKGTNIYSRLKHDLWTSYWCFDHYILRYRPGNKSYVIENSTSVRKIKRELRYLYSLIKLYRNKRTNELEKISIKNSLFLRAAYFLTRHIYSHKNIWISFDQLFKGGDNGEYFFRYMRENHKEIAMYYIINKDTSEYKELKPKYGHLLKFGSFRTKLMSLHAKMLFDTRADAKLYCGFHVKDEKYIRDLFNAEVVCLQHGLTIQKIAQYQNRLFDNFKHYYCVSPYEIDNIKKPIYGYTDDMISLTGAPRYDGLKGEPLKQILITPTWRRNVTEGTNKKGSNHEYSVNFCNTVYYKIYNTLINDQQLIACARETGYKLIYLIHPILSPQINDFETNDFVEICSGADVNYEKILKESDLMVTDYSGIQFDFAYMRRPLIYYHPNELPPQYEEGGLKYETMGFGPICKTNEQIVSELCKYMRNHCQLETVYKDRIEDFFPYSDQNNCQRVYEASIRFQNCLKNRKI